MMKLRIKEARERAGYTQTELAARIGVASNTFCGYENGLHDPKSKLLTKIASECHTTVDFLLGLSDAPERENEKSPAPEGTRDGAISLDRAATALVAMGYIREGEQLSDDDLAFLTHVMGLLDAWFRSEEQ
jgi:transcriptional regulator with XRE-family HTH domain